VPADFLRRAWQSKRFPLAILGWSAVVHAYAFSAVILDFTGPLRTDRAIMVGIDLLLACAGFAVRRVSRYRAIFCGRVVALAFFTLMEMPRSELAPILLAAMAMVEAFVYDSRSIATALGGAALAACAVPFLLKAADGGLARLASFLAATVPVLCAANAFFGYRDALSARDAELAKSEETVKSLIQANMDFQLLAKNVESESTANERNRITRELHDTIGYALTNVIVMMNAGKVLAVEDPAELPPLLDAIGRQAKEALDTTRQVLYSLRAIQRAEPTGLPAIASLVRNFQRATGVQVVLSYGNLAMSYGRNIDEALFRIIQEGLTNAFRHGKATKVTIIMGHQGDEIVATIHDDGRGLSPAAGSKPGIGFAGMRERLAIFGGTLESGNVVDGFALTARIPYRVREFNG
jgi:signal transduction histidine kinase